MMGLDNPIHIAFLLIVLLLVFGAKRLPELGHSLGTGLRGFKQAVGGEGLSSSLSVSDKEQSSTTAEHLAPAVPAIPAIPAAPAAPAAPLVGVQDKRSA